MIIEILFGPIASGKSTYSRYRAMSGAIIVNDDSIVTSVHGDYELYNKSLKPLYKSIENHIISMGISLGRDIIIDRPNLTKRSRSRYIGIANSCDVLIDAICFPWLSPEESAIKRFQSDSRGKSLEHWNQAAQRHYSIKEDPEESEGFHRVLQYANLYL